MYRACRSITNHLARTARNVYGWLGSSLPTDVSLIGKLLRKRICTSTVRSLSNKEFQIGNAMITQRPTGSARMWDCIHWISRCAIRRVSTDSTRSTLLHFVSKSVETLSFFQIRASSNRARSFFSAAAYASLPSKSRNGGFRSCVNWTIA
jgi:hypothetical protein